MEIPNMRQLLLCLAGILMAAPNLTIASPIEVDNAAVSAPRDLSPHLLTRADPHQSGPPNCGNSNTADKRNFMDMQTELANKSTHMSSTPAKTCRRHSCKNTSGIYVCNDNDHEVQIMYKTINEFAASVGRSCCTSDYTQSKGTSGQQFSDQGWNVFVAYANCNHGLDSDRPGFGPAGDPWGPNGECKNK